MALQVWLPLNKDTRNVGLTNVNVTNNGVTLTTGGIYGNCCSFNGSSHLTFATPASLLSTGHSICCWLDLTNINSTQYFLGFGKGGIRYGSDNSFLYYYNGQSLTWTYTKVNRFVHVAFVCNSNSVKLYIDGAQIGEAKSLSNGTNTCTLVGKRNDGYYYNGKMNDLRIYDHALTEEDVKRIYQCKVFGIDSHGWSTDTFVADTFDGYRQAKPVNIVATPSSLKFNGNSYVDTEGISMTGGTLSAWFTMSAIPTTNSNIIYCDQKSKMAIGFYTGNKLIVTCNGFYGNTYIHSNKLLANKWNNVTIVYNKSDGKPSMCYINGSQATSSATNYWTSTGEILSIGRRYGGSSPNYFNGSIGKIDVYSKPFTESEILEKYESEKNLFLPDDYIQLEYIQSNGTQYIDTGINGFNSGDWEIYCEWMSVAAPAQSYGYIFGVYEGENYNSYRLIHKTTSTTEYYVSAKSKAGGGSILLSNVALNTKHSIKIKNGTFTCDGVSYTASTTGTSLPSANTMLLFKSKNNLYSKCRIYSTWAKKDGILKYNMIPAKRKSDNIIGMYDMVSRQFFTNSGTGSFTGA